MTIPNPKDYYSENIQREWQRLLRHPVTEIEFETTRRYIEKYVSKGDITLDIGGGPGRYAFWLAENNHKVFLADYTKGLVDKARRVHRRLPVQIKRNILGIEEADVRLLPRFTDNEFDVTLCLGGVLSHVTKREDRAKALSELSRVTKKDGFILVSVIGLIAVLQSEIIKKFIDEVAEDKFFDIAKRGDYDGLTGFTACHFFTADDLRQTIESTGIEIVEMIGLEGFASSLEKPLREFRKNEKAWKNITATLQYYESHPSVVDMSEHILAICKNIK